MKQKWMLGAECPSFVSADIRRTFYAGSTKQHNNITATQMATQEALDDTAERQAAEFAAAIGDAVPVTVVDNAKERLQIARPPSIYLDHEEVPFLYEILESEGWQDAVLPVLNAWLAVRTHPKVFIAI
jgi:hypothetical protein